MRSRMLLVVIAPLALLLAACGGDDAVLSTDDATSGPGAAGPGWEALPEPPIGPRDQAAIAWTGTEIVVFGGWTFLCHPSAGCSMPEDPPLRDGAAYDPVAGTWRRIADAPVPVVHAATATLDGAVYALVTPRTITTEVQQTDLLRYEPESDRWTIFDVPADTPIDGLVATSSTLVAYPRSDEGGQQPDLEFDPADGTWTPLPDDPLSPAFDRSYAWDGTALHLFGKAITRSPGGEDGPAFITAARLGADDRWTELPAGDSLASGPSLVDGDRIVFPALGCADGGETNGYGRCISFGTVLDTTTGTWSELPEPPGGGPDDLWSGAVSADRMLLVALGHPMLDLTTDTWFEMPAIDAADDEVVVQRTVVGAGPYGFAFGGSRFPGADRGGDGPGTETGTLLGDAWLWSLSGRG